MSEDNKPEQPELISEVPATEVPPVAPVDAATKLNDLSAIVSQISMSDVRTLDVKKLREGLLQSIYLLEHCLFSQAGMEYQRIAEQRILVAKLEAKMFTDEALAAMDGPTRFRAYEIASKNLQFSTQFLLNLHKEAMGGMETINNIEKVKLDKPAEKPIEAVDRVKLDSIKKVIEQAIRNRIEEKKAANK